MTIAIVGAGLSGLAAAAELTRRGHAVTLIDKSRGVGGRMATRRAGDLAFDHGAPAVQPRGDRFTEVVRGWQAAGLAAPWDDGVTGVPGMTAPARALAAPHRLLSERTVTALVPGTDGWRLTCAEGTTEGPFAAVLLAIPAPQAAPLLPGFPELARVRYAPCWALMAVAEAAPFAAPALRDAGPFALIARNATKPGRAAAPETLVAHATADWSRAHLELDRDAVRDRLSAALAEVTGAAPMEATAHRWRLARVEQDAGVPCLWDAGQRLGACGDWASGGDAEGAFLSGEALAQAVDAAFQVS
jgi:predicted NAD/FAD-dependent oxidoreductase